MTLTSVNVGQPRVVQTPHGDVLTSIFKDPVEGRRRVIPHNVEGDRQPDLTVHGGPLKAIYAYGFEHYRYWSEELNEPLPPGSFGENLTIAEFNETNIHIGDLLSIGSARFTVTQPRMPCFKLNLRFGRSDMVKRFWRSGFSGVYFAVAEPGEIQSGDQVELLSSHPLKVSISDVVNLYQGASSNQDLFERAMASPLAGSWRKGIFDRWTGTK